MKKKEIKIQKKNFGEINVPTSLEECKMLIEELKLSQVSLELKNKELQKHSELLKDQLQKQNDFSGVEYLGRFSLSRDGIITDSDQIGFGLLKRLIAEPNGKSFISFLDKKSLPGFQLFLTNVFDSSANDWCSVTLNFSYNPTITVQIEGILVSGRAECIVKRKAAVSNPPENPTQLSDNEINYQFLLERLKEGVAIIHQNKSVAYINRPGELILGGDPGEFKNRNLEEIINSDQLKIIQNNPDCWDPEEKTNVGIDILTPKGEKKVLTVSCIPYFDNNGVKSGTLLIFIDKTEQKKKDKLNQRYSIIHRDLGFILGATTTIRQALFHVIHSMLRIIEVHAAGVYLIGQQSEELELMEHKGFSPAFIDSIRYSVLPQIYSHSVNSGVPVYGLCHEIFNDDETFIHKKLKQFGVIPVKHEEKTIGVVIIASKSQKKLSTESRIALETIVAQIGGTLARIKSEDTLKQSHKNLQLMFNTINDFMFILDSEGKIIIANSIVEQHLGYTQQELRGLSIQNVHPPERRCEVAHILDKMRKGQTSVFAIPLYRKNGDFIPVETKVEKGKWDGEDAIYYTSRDITERQKAEAKLMMQSLAFEAFTLAIIITDINGNIQWANSSFSNLSGYEMSEIIGKNPSQIIKSGKQGRDFYQTMWNTILSGKVWSGELINKRKDGNLFYEELTITPVKDYMGKITNFIAIIIDITSRKEMETALKVSEERWHFALDASGNGVWDLNLANYDFFISDQCKTMLGYSASEIENELALWESLLHPDDQEMNRKNFKKHYYGETEIYSSEYRIRCKDGSYVWVQNRGKIVEYTTEGKPLRVIGTQKDITNIKLHEEQLKKGIEREKELNELKSRFVATTSHEFRTPLASILMISDTLISYHQKMNFTQLTARLVKIKNHVLHLTDIVNNVLQLSKMQEGKIIFKPKEVELIAVCLNIIDGFNSGKLLKNQITFDSPFKELVISVDDRLIIQAINNLISNAIKYSDEEFSVDTGLRIENNELIFTVRDKGIGIPEKDIKHLFTPFFRAGNTASIQGNGLGLSIVRESLILHGGGVSCSNNADKGATFALHFPVKLISSYRLTREE